MSDPVETAAVTGRVVALVEDGHVQGLKSVERHEVRQALIGLHDNRQVMRHASGDVEPTRGRHGGGFKRAVRGSVLWSLPGNAAVGVEVGPA